MTFSQDPEINSDYPKTEHKYHVEFQFLKAVPTAIQCESPALSIPTISITVDDSSSSVEKDEAVVVNEDSSEESGQLPFFLWNIKTLLICVAYLGVISYPTSMYKNPSTEHKLPLVTAIFKEDMFSKTD